RVHPQHEAGRRRGWAYRLRRPDGRPGHGVEEVIERPRPDGRWIKRHGWLTIVEESRGSCRLRSGDEVVGLVEQRFAVYPAERWVTAIGSDPGNWLVDHRWR